MSESREFSALRVGTVLRMHLHHGFQALTDGPCGDPSYPTCQGTHNWEIDKSADASGYYTLRGKGGTWHNGMTMWAQLNDKDHFQKVGA